MLSRWKTSEKPKPPKKVRNRLNLGLAFAVFLIVAGIIVAAMGGPQVLLLLI